MHIPLQEELFGAAVNGPVRAVLVPQSNARERIKFTGSVKWSGRQGRRPNVALAPYISVNSAGEAAHALDHNLPALINTDRRRARSPIESSDDDEKAEYDYIDISASNGPERDFLKFVGRKFSDEDDDIVCRVMGICEMRKVRGRKSTNVLHAFKYIDTGGDAGEFLYTPCREMLNSYWCKWLAEETPEFTPRARRACASYNT